MAEICLNNLIKIYDKKVTAVDKINLKIKDKEFVVIVGPSGCGKTTTLRMIAGLEDITSGTIEIGDRVVNDIAPKDRDIAMVFQNYALYPHMTVYNNMAFGLKLRKISKPEIKIKIKETAEMLGIDHLLDRKPKALSGGQRQRVALGRAIVREPVAFLFDEPLSNLDAKLRVTTRAELKALHYKLQTTSVYVTHDQAEAMTLGDRICVMYKGVVQQYATPIEVYDRPVNRFVAGFLGTPSMNFFDGRVCIESDNVRFVFQDNSSVLLKRFSSKLKEYAGREAVLGIRPEHLTVKQFPEQNENSIRSTVDVIELLGDRKDVHLTSSSGQKYIANLDPHTSINLDDNVMVYLDINKINIFEKGQTGENLSF